jgi:rRNA-processing protein FCF1
LSGAGKLVAMLVTLAPGADVTHVLDLLFKAKTTINNNHHDPVGYVAWANEQAEVLRNQIRPTDIDRLINTPRFWRLVELGDRGGLAVQDFLRAELTEQAQVWEQAWLALQTEINRWRSDAYVIVVDTSVFIHHPDKIRDIRYAGLLGVGFEEVRVVVPRVVVDELDRLKESSNKHTRWRAAHTLGVLDELLDRPRSRAALREADNFREVQAAGGTPHGKVTIEVLFDDAHHVRLADNDDEIIDRTLALLPYTRTFPARLLTMDTSMALRARMLNVRVLKPTKEIGEEPPSADPRPIAKTVAAPRQSA